MALLPEDRKRESRAAGRLDHPESLTVLSLSGDGRGLAIGPQLAAFASSHGRRHAPVDSGGSREGGSPVGGLRDRASRLQLRPGLYVGDVPDGETIDLTIILVVLDRKQPDLGDAPASEATILAVAAGSATEQELARVALAVDDAGRRIDGIVVADPDQTDRTSGRHTMEERSRRPALPVRLTGIASSDAAPAGRTGAAHDPGTHGTSRTSTMTTGIAGSPSPTLVSLHFIRSALRRRWLVCVLSAILGLLVAAAFLVVFPAAHARRQHWYWHTNKRDEPSRAMATDVSLLRTRTVAARTIASLGLTMTPDDFLKSVTAVPVSSELLSVTLTAPSDAEAIRRLEALTSIYLDFRGEQLSMQSNVYVDGIQQRIEKLESEVAALIAAD